MGRKPRWKFDGNEEGVVTYTLQSWKYFHDFILHHKLMDYKTYIYRGQQNEKWPLEPSVNRQIDKKLSKVNYNQKITEHLDNFKYSIRGRVPFLKEILDDKNELWALGQHNGLKTPLLDFTLSPYVAAYFAFHKASSDSDYRIIWGASQHTTENQVDDKLSLFKPVSGYNTRLINQSGLFIKFNVNKNLEEIVKKSRKDIPREAQLYKIRIPNTDRIMCLRFLNRMNINHNTLFPDVYGASIYTNSHLEIKNY